MKNLIEKMSVYVGSSEPKNVSVTEVAGGEVLQAYLRRKATPNPMEIGDNTLGSIFDAGIRSYIKDCKDVDRNRKMEAGERTSIQLNNGWKLSGEADTLVRDGNGEIVEIRDTKLTKQYAKKSILEDKLHPYRIQLNLYRLLYAPNAKMYLDVFIKDSNPLKGTKVYEQIEVQKINDFELETMCFNFSNKLESQLAKHTIFECSETWGGRRCEMYCSYSMACKKNFKF